MNKLNAIKPGDVLQISPEIENKAFASCFMTVTKVADWYVQGYVTALGNNRDAPGSLAYLRAPWEMVEYIGVAEWVDGEPSHG